MFIDKSRVVGCLDDDISVVVFSEDDPMKVVIIQVSKSYYSKIKAVLDYDNAIEATKKGGGILKEPA